MSSAITSKYLLPLPILTIESTLRTTSLVSSVKIFALLSKTSVSYLEIMSNYRPPNMVTLPSSNTTVIGKILA